jgi:hypothetical protein
VLVTSQALLRRQPRIFLAVTLKSMLKFEATRVPRPERGIAWLGDGNLGVRRQYVFEERFVLSSCQGIDGHSIDRVVLLRAWHGIRS